MTDIQPDPFVLTFDHSRSDNELLRSLIGVLTTQIAQDGTDYGSLLTQCLVDPDELTAESMTRRLNALSTAFNWCAAAWLRWEDDGQSALDHELNRLLVPFAARYLVDLPLGYALNDLHLARAGGSIDIANIRRKLPEFGDAVFVVPFITPSGRYAMFGMDIVEGTVWVRIVGEEHVDDHDTVDRVELRLERSEHLDQSWFIGIVGEGFGQLFGLPTIDRLILNDAQRTKVTDDLLAGIFAVLDRPPSNS